MPPSPLPATALPAARLATVVAASSGNGGATPPRPTPRRVRRGKPGFSRQSAIKKSFHQEQVVFSTPVPADPTVAVIGGGASGLACASALAARGVRSVVFDTGMYGLGGRMATRFVDGGEQLVFDHAAQFFTASDERFQRLVDEWLDRGLVREWRGLIGELEAGGRFTPIPSSTPRYIGVNGMRSLADAMLPECFLTVREDAFCGWFCTGPNTTATLADRACANDRTATECGRCLEDAERAAAALGYLARIWGQEVLVVGHDCSLRVQYSIDAEKAAARLKDLGDGDAVI